MKGRLWWAASLSLLSLGTASGEEMPVAADLQGALFKKILAYDRTLPADTKVQLLVVYSGEPSGEIGDIVWAFSEVGFASGTTRDVDLPSVIGRAAVVYFAPGVDAGQFESLLVENRVLSISGVPSKVERGEASIGVGLRDHRPEIIVHLARAKAEGHELSSDLLRLSRVIR